MKFKLLSQGNQRIRPYISHNRIVPTSGSRVVDRSVVRGRWLSLFFARGQATDPDCVRKCTEIHKISDDDSLNLWELYGTLSVRVLVEPDRFFVEEGRLHIILIIGSGPMSLLIKLPPSSNSKLP